MRHLQLEKGVIVSVLYFVIICHKERFAPSGDWNTNWILIFTLCFLLLLHNKLVLLRIISVISANCFLLSRQCLLHRQPGWWESIRPFRKGNSLKFSSYTCDIFICWYSPLCANTPFCFVGREDRGKRKTETETVHSESCSSERIWYSSWDSKIIRLFFFLPGLLRLYVIDK